MMGISSVPIVVTLLLILQPNVLAVKKSSGSSWFSSPLRRVLKQERPADYVDDIHHCGRARLSDDDTVHCDPTSFKWDVNMLDPDEPPQRCGDLGLEPGSVVVNSDDWVEPCVLWHLTYGDLAPSKVPSVLPSTIPSSASSSVPSTVPSSMPSSNPSLVPPSEEPSISTLSPSTSPKNIALSKKTKTTLPSTSPSTLSPVTSAPVTPAPVTAAPITPSPTEAPVSSSAPVTEMLFGPFTFSPTSGTPGSSAPSIDITDKPIVRMSLFSIELTVPKQLRRRLQVDFSETRQIVLEALETHLHQYLQDSLGIDIVGVRLAATALRAQETSTVTFFSTQVAGTVVFPEGSVLPTSNTVDFLVEDAFTGTAVIEFLDLLQLSKDPNLTRVLDVRIISTSSFNGRQNNPGGASNQSSGEEPTISIGFIIIVVGASAAAFAVAILVYVMLTSPSRRERDDSLRKTRSDDTPHTQVSPVPSDVEAHHENDDAQSDVTSTYSYKHDELSLVSLANSFMYSVVGGKNNSTQEDLESNSIAQGPPSLLWGGSDGDSYNEETLQPDVIISTSPAKKAEPATTIKKSNASFLGVSSDDESFNRVFYNTEDDDSFLGNGGANSVLQLDDPKCHEQSQEYAPSPGRPKFRTVWKEAAIDSEEQQSTIVSISLADDSRDWKEKYQIPDDGSESREP